MAKKLTSKQKKILKKQKRNIVINQERKLKKQVALIREQAEIAKYSLKRGNTLFTNKALETLSSKSEGILQASEKLLSTSLTKRGNLFQSSDLIKKTLENINEINTPGVLREGLVGITLKRNGEAFILSAEQHKSLYDEYVQRLKQMYKDIEERYPDERNTPPDLIRTRKALKKLHKNNFKTKYRFNDWLNDRQSVNEDIHIRGISTQRLRKL